MGWTCPLDGVLCFSGCSVFLCLFFFFRLLSNGWMDFHQIFTERRLCSQGVSHTRNFRTTPPGFREKGWRERKEGGGKGRGKEKGRDPHGLVDTPYVPNCDLMSATCEKVLYPFQQRPRVPLCMQVSKKFQYFSNSSWRINSWHSILFYSLRNLTIDIIFLDFMWETILQCTHFSFTIIFI